LHSFNIVLNYSKSARLLGRLWLPDKLNPNLAILLVWIHWMDSRGYLALTIYENFAKRFTDIGYPVLLFDQVGSGKSNGKWEFPEYQAQQLQSITEEGIKILRSKLAINKWKIIGLGHSLGGVTLMWAVMKGFPFSKGVFLSVPPSHGRSIKREIKNRGHWRRFQLMSYFDIVTGMMGFPLTFNLFGFKLRLKDLRKHMLTSHAVRMSGKLPKFPILAIFGSNDIYISDMDIALELNNKFPWIRKIIIPSATHDMEVHQKQVFQLIQAFIED